jgi:hypothetical protein
MKTISIVLEAAENINCVSGVVYVVRKKYLKRTADSRLSYCISLVVYMVIWVIGTGFNEKKKSTQPTGAFPPFTAFRFL